MCLGSGFKAFYIYMKNFIANPIIAYKMVIINTPRAEVSASNFIKIKNRAKFAIKLKLNIADKKCESFA